MATTLTRRPSACVQTERPREERSYSPDVDIIETPDELLLIADLPGVTAENVTAQYERGTLTIQGRPTARQEREGRDWLLNEYGVGDFHRAFQLGEGIDAERIVAEVADGVLTLHLPKAAKARVRKIPVKCG